MPTSRHPAQAGSVRPYSDRRVQGGAAEGRAASVTAEGPGAAFSPDRRYRYLLTREIEPDSECPTLSAGVTFIALNPSTADEVDDDPTIRRMIRFASRWGSTRLHVVNLSPLVATHSRDLEATGPEPEDVALRNIQHVASVTRCGELVVAAWGKPGALEGRDERMLGFLRESGVGVVHCLAENVDGSPRHPLYMRSETEPRIYRTL